MRINARNTLKGKVIRIKSGTVNTEVVAELPGGAQVVSIVAKEHADNLGITVGKSLHYKCFLWQSE